MGLVWKSNILTMGMWVKLGLGLRMMSLTKAIKGTVLRLSRICAFFFLLEYLVV
jgi:hypothetical protein